MKPASFPSKMCPFKYPLYPLEEICLKCDYVVAGDLSGIMFNHVSDFATVSVKSLFYMSNSSTSPNDKVQI